MKDNADELRTIISGSRCPGRRPMTGNYPKRPELHGSNDGTNKMDVTSESTPCSATNYY